MTSQWKSPNWGQFDFGRDCELYGAWLSASQTADVWNEEQGWALGANFMRSILLLINSLPSGWQTPTAVESAEWWVQAYMVDFDYVSNCYLALLDEEGCQAYEDNFKMLRYALYELPGKKCGDEVCKAIALAANPDLAGIGVIISYLLEASLVTVFMVAFLVDSFRHQRWNRFDRAAQEPPRPPTSKIDYLIDVFRHSVKAFFDSAAFLGMAMLVAAIYTTYESMTFRERERNTKVEIFVLTDFYDVKFALLSSLFCIMPIVMLSLISDQGKRRRLVRMGLLSVAYMLCIALVFLAPKAEWDSGKQYEVQIMCDQRGGAQYWQGLAALQGLVIGIPILAIILSTLILNPFNLVVLEENRVLMTWRRWWPHILGGLTFVAMWTILGIFLDMRDRIQRLAGNADKTGDMGFGQVLALFAWAPVLLTLGCQMICGPTTAYNWELAMGYRAIPDDESDGVTEFNVGARESLIRRDSTRISDIV